MLTAASHRGREGSEGKGGEKRRPGRKGDGRPHSKPLIASSMTTGRAEMLTLWQSIYNHLAWIRVVCVNLDLRCSPKSSTMVETFCGWGSWQEVRYWSFSRCVVLTCWKRAVVFWKTWKRIEPYWFPQGKIHIAAEEHKTEECQCLCW